MALRDWFQPRGEFAEWKMLYQAFHGKAYGSVITYEEIADVLGRPIDGHNNRHCLYRFDQELQRRNHKALQNVQGVGYRVLRPEKVTPTTMDARTKRVQRQLVKAKRALGSVPLWELTEEQQLYHADAESKIGWLLTSTRSVRRRDDPPEDDYRSELEAVGRSRIPQSDKAEV